MLRLRKSFPLAAALILAIAPLAALAQTTPTELDLRDTRASGAPQTAAPISPQYRLVQQRLARGWNTWDVNSVTTHVLLPEGLALHLGLVHNNTVGSSRFLPDALIGSSEPDAAQVFPGPHAWDGSYTDLSVTWRGHAWRVQSAHAGADLVLLVTPLQPTPNSPPTSALPPTLVVSVNFLWNQPGTALRQPNFIATHGSQGDIPIYCTCQPASPHPQRDFIAMPLAGPYFSADLVIPIGISTGHRRTLAQVTDLIDGQRWAYEKSISTHNQTGSIKQVGPIFDAIQTTLGWDTIYEPAKHRVISPVSRNWSIHWGGYVLFDWDTFFAATLCGIGDRDLAYANALEMLREETPAGFVPNYARGDGWESFDRSEPPVGAITVLNLYRQYHDRWFLADSFAPLLRWNRWWNDHRQIDGYLAWGSDGENLPANADDTSSGERQGAIFESGLDNSPMYDTAVYNKQTHLLEYADVGLMGLYIADCNALADIADTLGKSAEAAELRARSARYTAKLQTMWSDADGMFLNRDLHTGQVNRRLSPTNFYPLIAHAATPAQAAAMIQRHLLNPNEFWGQYVIPSIERDDPGFKDQNYWRGRIWGPMNYLVYLGLLNYAQPQLLNDYAQKSYDLFLKEWTANGHVHENYNAVTGQGDDVRSSDRFYHWGALLGYIQYMQQSGPTRNDSLQ
jgi:hypothetical protein